MSLVQCAALKFQMRKVFHVDKRRPTIFQTVWIVVIISWAALPFCFFFFSLESCLCLCCLSNNFSFCSSAHNNLYLLHALSQPHFAFIFIRPVYRVLRRVRTQDGKRNRKTREREMETSTFEIKASHGKYYTS